MAEKKEKTFEAEENIDTVQEEQVADRKSVV